MDSKYVLWFGAVVSALYIWVVTFFQTDNSYKDVLKYLYIKNDDSIVVVAKLPDSDRARKFVSSLKSKCKDFRCDIDSSFSKSLSQKDEIELFKNLQKFSLTNNLTHASLVAVGKNIEINFLLKDENQLESLKNSYKPFEDKFFIKDNSSVIKVFDIDSIENNINKILNENEESLEDISFDLKTRKIFNQIFRKIKALGVVRADLVLKTDKPTDKIKDYILQNYSWIKDINITTGNKNSIKIKEVQ